MGWVGELPQIASASEIKLLLYVSVDSRIIFSKDPQTRMWIWFTSAHDVVVSEIPSWFECSLMFEFLMQLYWLLLEVVSFPIFVRGGCDGGGGLHSRFDTVKTICTLVWSMVLPRAAYRLTASVETFGAVVSYICFFAVIAPKETKGELPVKKVLAIGCEAKHGPEFY